MTQLPSLERWALFLFGGFPTLTCFLFFSEPVIFRNLYNISLASVGTFSGSFLFYLYFSVTYFGLATEIRFFALKSKKEKGGGTG